MFKTAASKGMFFVVFFTLFSAYLLINPPSVGTVNLTSASVTLSNSRASFRAGLGTTASANSSIVLIRSIGTGSTQPDMDTDNLFPNDTACFWSGSATSCTESIAVANNLGSGATAFNLQAPLANTYANNSSNAVLINQRTNMTISFVLGSTVPSNGDILVTIPAADSNIIGAGGTANTFDGLADTATSVSLGGFDMAGGGSTIAYGDITVSSSGCDNNWNTTETVSVGTDTTDHTIRIDRQTNACASGSTITITTSNTKIVNPAPVNTSHTQGTADIYTINVKTRDGSDQTLDQIDIDIAPVEGVLVSATVDETLSFQVQGRNSGTTSCGAAADVTTTAMAVPWGTLSSFDTFYNAAQQLTVSTNADAGYAVTVEEDDQMKKDETNTCNSPTEATADHTDNCIKDTTCDDTTCTQASADDWETASNNGFGFALENQSGSDATFAYDGTTNNCDGAGTDFCARQIAEQQVPETKANVMSSSAPVSGSSVYVCYRISVDQIQPAGFYFNKVKYTATATF